MWWTVFEILLFPAGVIVGTGLAFYMMIKSVVGPKF